MKPTIKELFDLKTQAGMVGVEVEFELQTGNFPIVNGWNRTNDGSLRGYGIEYNFVKPVSKEVSLNLIENLYTSVGENNTILESPRAGVHVHINMQKLTEYDVMKFILLYLMMENVLVKWCGENREGNMFCMRSKDAEGLLIALNNVLDKKTLLGTISPELRYSSINVCSLAKFGSLEFRSLETPCTAGRVQMWVKLLYKLFSALPMFTQPTDIVEGFSLDGTEPFLRGIFGDLYDEIVYPTIEDDLYDGVRIIQQLAYRPWEFKEKEEHVVRPHTENMYTLSEYRTRMARPTFTTATTTNPFSTSTFSRAIYDSRIIFDELTDLDAGGPNV